MPRPRVTFSRKGTTSSGPSGPPNDTSRRASYGLVSGVMGPIVGSGPRLPAGHRGPLPSGCDADVLPPGPRASIRPSSRRVLGLPGTFLFSATGLVARLPISMVGLGIVLLVSAATGSYGVAGSVSAAYMVANAILAILQGQLVDRLGQARVLATASAVFGVSMVLLIWSV